jgi:1,4-dihydroxy-2-naphthoate octaprenyltransferase
MLKQLKIWFPLFRPWSVTATLVPALLALAAVHTHPSFSMGRWILAVIAAAPLQFACNLLNTWGDDRSGVDGVAGAFITTPQLQSGLVSSRQVLGAAIACLAFTFLCGIPLLFVSFRPDITLNLRLAAVAAISFLGATNYTTGLRFKYYGLGVPFVFFLMGLFAYAGFWAAAAPTAPFTSNMMLTSLPICCLVAVILHGNDMRDITSDTAAGIITTASRLGPRGALILFWALHLIPYAVVLATGRSWPLSLLPLTLAVCRKAWRVYRENPLAPAWRGLDRASGGLHMLFGTLYAFSCA